MKKNRHGVKKTKNSIIIPTQKAEDLSPLNEMEIEREKNKNFDSNIECQEVENASSSSQESYDFETDFNDYQTKNNNDHSTNIDELSDELKLKNIIKILKGSQKQEFSGPKKLKLFTEFIIEILDNRNGDINKDNQKYIFSCTKLINTVSFGLLIDQDSERQNSKSIRKLFQEHFDALILFISKINNGDEQILLLSELIVKISNNFFAKNFKNLTKTLSLLFDKLKVIEKHESKIRLLIIIKESSLICPNNYDITIRKLFNIITSFDLLIYGSQKIDELIDGIKNILVEHNKCLGSLSMKIIRQIGLRIEDLKKNSLKSLNLHSDKQIFSWNTVLMVKSVVRFTFDHKNSEAFNILFELLSIFVLRLCNETQLPFIYHIIACLVEKQLLSHDIFLPLISPMLFMLNKHNFNLLSKTTDSSSWVSFDDHLMVSKSDLSTYSFNKVLIDQFFKLLHKYLQHWQFSIAFPELSEQALIWLRQFSNNVNNKEFSKTTRDLIDQIEKHYNRVKKLRSNIEIDLRNQQSIVEAECHISKIIEKF